MARSSEAAYRNFCGIFGAMAGAVQHLPALIELVGGMR
jgi:hypothetical protein